MVDEARVVDEQTDGAPAQAVVSNASPPEAGESPDRTVRWAAVAVGAVVFGLVALLAFGSDDRLDPPNAVLGARVPDVSGETLEGETYDIDSARGKWVVVNFFATWCPPCINEHPELLAFQRWAEETGKAEVVAVVFNDSPEGVAAFFETNGGDWPVLDDPSIPIEFQVAKIPETFVVAPSGQVVQHIKSEVTAADLVATIEGS